MLCRDNSTPSEETHLSSPSLVWVTEGGDLAMGDLPGTGGYRGRRVALQPKSTLALGPSESVLQVTTNLTCQLLFNAVHFRESVGKNLSDVLKHGHTMEC